MTSYEFIIYAPTGLWRRRHLAAQIENLCHQCFAPTC